VKAGNNITGLAAALLSFCVTLAAALLLADHWRSLLDRLWFW
jgi:hypothetical protein